MIKSKGIINITNLNFDNIVSDGITLIDFWAPWCGPCRMFSNILDEINNEFIDNEKIKIAKINVDDEQELTQKFKIKSIPAIMIFKNSNLEKQFVGIQSKETLINEIKKLI